MKTALPRTTISYSWGAPPAGMVFAVPRRPSSQEGAPGPCDPGFRATREASGCVVLMRVSRCGGMPAVHNERGGGGRCCSTPSSDSSRGLRWRALWCAGVAVWSTSTDDSACRPGSTSAVQLHVSVAATVVSAPYRQPRPDIRLFHGVDRRLCRHGNLSINLWVVYSPHMHRDPVVSCFACPPFESPSPPTSRRPPTPYSFRAPPTARARPMLHRRAFPLSRNVVTASPHPPPPSHVPHVRVDAERRRGQHSSWLEPSALHRHGTGVRRRRKPRGASRKGRCFDLPCHGAPGAGVALGRPAPAPKPHTKKR